MFQTIPSFSTNNWRIIKPTELAEIRQREFLTDEWWVKQKQKLDSCLMYRKSIKGKPTEEQMHQLSENAITIQLLKRLLFGERS